MYSPQKKLVIAINTVIDMLLYRGEDVSDIEPLRQMKADSIQETLDSAYLASLSIATENISITFCMEPSKDNQPAIKKHTIWISMLKPKTQQIKGINSQIQIFHVDELLIDITKNALVPRHELVEEAVEIELILKSLRASANQLPKISVEDPMAKFIGAKLGNLVRILRDSKQAGQYVIYRIVM